MAEILGTVASCMTVASLLKLCLEAFEAIQVGRRQGIDYEKLSVRLNIERARLYTWGEAMALSDEDLTSSVIGTGLLARSPFQALVMDTLNLILRLFRDGDKLCSAYGCSVYHERLDRTRLLQESTNEVSKNAMDNPARSFSCFRV